MIMQNFGVTNKEHYGMLRYFWSGQFQDLDSDENQNSSPVGPEVALTTGVYIGKLWSEIPCKNSGFVHSKSERSVLALKTGLFR